MERTFTQDEAKEHCPAADKCEIARRALCSAALIHEKCGVFRQMTDKLTKDQQLAVDTA